MSGEPDAEEIIKAARNRTRKPKATPGGESQPTPVTTPEAPVEAAAEVVSGEPVDKSPVETLERMGVAAEAASEAVKRFKRMWG